MKNGLKTAFRWTGIVLLACAAIAAVSAAIVTALAMTGDIPAPGKIGFGDAWSFNINEDGISGNMGGLGLWFVLTLGFLIVTGALAFSLGLVIAVLAGVGLLLAGLVALLTSPIWIVLLIVWAIKRTNRAHHTQAAANAA